MRADEVLPPQATANTASTLLHLLVAVRSYNDYALLSLLTLIVTIISKVNPMLDSTTLQISDWDRKLPKKVFTEAPKQRSWRPAPPQTSVQSLLSATAPSGQQKKYSFKALMYLMTDWVSISGILHCHWPSLKTLTLLLRKVYLGFHREHRLCSVSQSTTYTTSFPLFTWYIVSLLSRRFLLFV